MAKTAISNVIVPEVYTDYAREGSIYSNRFFKSQIIQTDPRFGLLLDGGASIFNLPFWKMNDVFGASTLAVNEGDTLTPDAITAGKMVGRRQFREKAFGANDVAAVLAGSNPMDAIKAALDGFWLKNMQAMLFASIKGVIGNNVAADSSDLCLDITALQNSAIDSAVVIDAVQLFGDMDQDIVAIGMHSKVLATLRKANMIDDKPDNEQNIGWGTYLGKTVIVDDTLVVTGSPNVYWSVLFKRGAFAYAESFANYVADETYREPLKSGGEESLITRRVMLIHPNGFSWTSNTESNDFPTDANLALAANWDRVAASAKNCGFAVIKSLS